MEVESIQAVKELAGIILIGIAWIILMWRM